MLPTLVFDRVQGLGERYDLDNVGGCGAFDVIDPENGPGAGRWFLMQYRNSDESVGNTYILQFIYKAVDGDEYYRVYENHVWTAWSKRPLVIDDN